MSAAEFMSHLTKLILEREKIEWSEDHHHTLRLLIEYIDTLPYTPTRWDAIYLCVAEFGKCDEKDLEVINYLYKQRLLFS